MKKLLKFGVIGSCGFLVDISITYFFKEILGFNQYIANGIGFVIATSFNYYSNKRWTFNEKIPISFSQFFSFFSISLFGLLLSTMIIYLLVEKSSTGFYISKIISVLIVFLWNFYINKALTFRPKGNLKRNNV